MGSRKNNHDLIAKFKHLGIHVSEETERKLKLSFIDYLKQTNELKQKLVSHLEELEPETLSDQDRQTLQLLEHLLCC